MASTKTRTKTIRLANEAADFYENVPLNRIAESVYALINEGKLKIEGEEIKIPVSKPEVQEEIEFMVSISGMEVEDFYKRLGEILEEGELMIERGRLIVKYPQWAEDFRDACHDMCIPVEKAVENAIKAMKK